MKARKRHPPRSVFGTPGKPKIVHKLKFFKRASRVTVGKRALGSCWAKGPAASVTLAGWLAAQLAGGGLRPRRGCVNWKAIELSILPVWADSAPNGRELYQNCAFWQSGHPNDQLARFDLCSAWFGLAPWPRIGAARCLNSAQLGLARFDSRSVCLGSAWFRSAA